MSGPIITPFSLTQPVVTDGNSMERVMRTFVSQVTTQSRVIGTGSPEGVVKANQGTDYMDDAGTAGAILYIKRDPDDGLGDTSKGWILV